ncbi:MAG: GntR family transcriptional regulator [Actinomycetes bacterium]
MVDSGEGEYVAAKYEEVLKDLSRRISGMGAGERLPSEQELARTYGVSGMTVRRALQVLIEAKRLVGIRGKGTFVSQPTVTKRMVMASFTDSMKAAGMTAGAKVLSASLQPADRMAADALGLRVGEQVITLSRLRSGDDTPLCLDRTTLRAEAFPGLLGEDLTGSLYEVLRTKYGVQLSRAESRVSAVLPTPEEAVLLNIPATQPCIRVTVLSMTDDGLPGECTVSVYRGDRYELHIGPAPDRQPAGTARATS